MDDENRESLEKARDALAAKLFDNPDVVMIDIGKDEEQEVPVLRVHVRESAGTLPGLPHEVDGIPVRLLSGDYRLEESEP